MELQGYTTMIHSQAQQDSLAEFIQEAQNFCHGIAWECGWWHDPHTGNRLDRNKGELICLMHSELSEAMEGARKGLMDDHLPHRKMEEVELADTIIRILDYAGGHGLDVGGALVEKLKFNVSRSDHKPSERVKEGGKKW